MQQRHLNVRKTSAETTSCEAFEGLKMQITERCFPSTTAKWRPQVLWLEHHLWPLKVKFHLYSAICIASEALLVNHLYSTPSQGRLRQCRLGFEHDTLRLLPLPPHAGTQPNRPTGHRWNWERSKSDKRGLFYFIRGAAEALHWSLARGATWNVR